MNMKRLTLAGCSAIVLGAGTAWAGPCDMGRTANKDAGSGPASQSSSQTTGMSTDAKRQTQPTASEQSQKMTAGTTEQTQPAPIEQSEKMTAGSAQPAPSEKKTAGAAEQGC